MCWQQTGNMWGGWLSVSFAWIRHSSPSYPIVCLYRQEEQQGLVCPVLWYALESPVLSPPQVQVRSLEVTAIVPFFLGTPNCQT